LKTIRFFEVFEITRTNGFFVYDFPINGTTSSPIMAYLNDLARPNGY
jgi:hypothetical protein